jgi:DNA-binding NtrC family response regulator
MRDCFLAGARDVILDASSAVLAERIEQTLEQQQILPRLDDLERRRGRSPRFESMLSRSARMWELFELCTRVAPTDATVLIFGETGTGKELLARALHRCSGRRGRFVAANCASIPRDLINSELFGYERGAFTGADRSKTGLVVHASDGTLFLDEIGDMPAESQQALLRMLQEKRIRPVGGQAEIEINARIVAATNVLLDEAVRDGSFRQDLFYRLDVIRINVPALRERPEDILFLFGHFTKRLAKHYGLNPPSFSDEFCEALLSHAWPGNVRQLENFSERLVLARPQRVLTARDFEQLQSSSYDSPPPTGKGSTGIARSRSLDMRKPLQENITAVVEQLECSYLQAALAENAGRVAAAAEQAGISRRTLLRKMNQYNIDKQDFKPDASGG